MTVAVHTGRLIESGDRASASQSDSEPTEITAAEAGTSSQWRRAVISSSSEEVEERMLCRHCQRFVAKDLTAMAFGDVRDEAPDAP